MSSSTQSSLPTNILINIPPEFIENGKTLLIEKHDEVFVDGYHLSKPSHFIRQSHGFCLIDTQQQDPRSVNHSHQLESTIDDIQFVQIIIEFPGQSLNDGKSITIEKVDSINEEKVSENYEDLYNDHSDKKEIHIGIRNDYLQRGNTIIIEKGNISLKQTKDYQKEQLHHLSNNQFAKRDHLQSNDLMEMTIEVPPELFLKDQMITFKREDSETKAADFPYHRHSKSDITTND
ncbi:hypothetical protein I4U23_017369 [Adineta vaga]|nr:hypothetical protein I4U23_017369 [Adineta vaga]